MNDPWKISEDEFPRERAWADQLQFLVRYAVLAPSSHNTQPWRFKVENDQIDLFMDESGWLKVADDDQRELHISVGCALENLLVAAEYFGFGHEAHLLPDPANPIHAARITFRQGGQPSPERPSLLFRMITVRHTNHSDYDGRPIDVNVQKQFRDCCVEEGISLYLTSDEEKKHKVDELVVKADAIEFSDPAFREELGYWIGQGAFGTSWLMSKIGKLAVTHINMGRTQAKKDSSVLMSSPVLGLISSERDDRASQIKVGQIYERLSLLAASVGIWCQPMSQIVQVEEIKQELAMLQPQPEMSPQHPFRLGFAEPEKHHTPRQALADVLS